MAGGLDLLLAASAAVAAGAVNALAGGGTLITFPTLVEIGVPPVAANVTNTVALCPGYLGATFAQRKDIGGQKVPLQLLLTVSAIGGVIGGSLLLVTGERVFRALVPFLILFASGLLAFGDPMRAWIERRSSTSAPGPASAAAAAVPVGLAAIYGGYFGAGLSVIVLSVLSLMIGGSLTRLNASKQAIALTVNVAAALLFVFSGKVLWDAALVMAVGALIGGVLGGRLAGRIKAGALRWTVVSIGIVVAIIYFTR
jgi:uncharacterized membrane protein YfcA